MIILIAIDFLIMIRGITGGYLFAGMQVYLFAPLQASALQAVC